MIDVVVQVVDVFIEKKREETSRWGPWEEVSVGHVAFWVCPLPFDF